MLMHARMHTPKLRTLALAHSNTRTHTHTHIVLNKKYRLPGYEASERLNGNSLSHDEFWRVIRYLPMGFT